MTFSSWRGTVGVIKPTYRPGGTEEMIRLLPEGIGVIPLYIGIRQGTVDEFRSVLERYEERVKELAEIGVDLIHPEGAPPFMVHGADGEREIVGRWEKQYNIPIFTSAQLQIDVMRALGMRRVLGLTYFGDDINNMTSRYWQDHGFEVVAMEGIEVPFDQVQRLSSHEIYAFARAAFRKHPDVDGISMLGTGWRTLDILALLEQDLEVPVAHPVTGRVWEIQVRLGVLQRTKGYGKILEDLPRLP
jgi:maleate isomerase